MVYDGNRPQTRIFRSVPDTQSRDMLRLGESE